MQCTGGAALEITFSCIKALPDAFNTFLSCYWCYWCSSGCSGVIGALQDVVVFKHCATSCNIRLGTVSQPITRLFSDSDQQLQVDHESNVLLC